MMPAEQYKADQIAWELEAIGLAQLRQVERQDNAISKGSGASTAGGKDLLRGAVPEMASGIRNYLDREATRKTAGPPRLCAGTIGKLDPDTLAAGCVQAVIGTLTKAPGAIQKILVALGSVVEGMLWFQGLTVDQATKVYEKTHDTNGSHQRRYAKAISLAKRIGADHQPWSSDEKAAVGRDLLNILIGATGIVEVSSDNKVYLTEEALKLLQEANRVEAGNSVLTLPMVYPPRPWVSMKTGAYLTTGIRRHMELVRTHDAEHKERLRQALYAGTMSRWLATVNSLQATPFKINERVLAVQEQVLSRGGGVGKMPATKKLEALEFPKDFDTLEPRAKAGILLRYREIKVSNQTVDHELAVLRRDIEVAKRLTKYPQFWVPVSADFRGRVYPIPHFNYQRSDPVKALFMFARGVPLGDRGLWWLKVQAANCWDLGKVSKKSFDDRVKLIEDNRDTICALAADPVSHMSVWGTADKPWQFLAACFELAEAWSLPFPGAYIGHISCALDGSNSGLQHYSAALRAKYDGAQVNLTPQSVPADIYQVVANKVIEAVVADAGDGLEEAKLWLAFGCDRGVVKRSVMTYAYASSTFGFKEQLIEDLMKPLAGKVIKGELEEHPFGLLQWQCSGYLAKLIYAAVCSTVVQAGAGMKFFQTVAALLAHESKPVIWVTPLGLPVMSVYREMEVKRVEWWLSDRSLPLTVDTVLDDYGNPMRRVRANILTKPTKKIMKSKARSAVAPNVIHSADASHLLLTVETAGRDAETGIVDFMMIHDSFGTHCGNTEKYFGTIRDAFVELYEGWCPFQSLYDAAWLSLSDKGRDKLPSIPLKGDLDITDVRRSLYAFA